MLTLIKRGLRRCKKDSSQFIPCGDIQVGKGALKCDLCRPVHSAQKKKKKKGTNLIKRYVVKH